MVNKEGISIIEQERRDFKNMEKAKISIIQLFSLMFIFEMGTVLVVSYGICAGKDAWLAILLGMCGGIFLFLIYHSLFSQYPNLLIGVILVFFSMIIADNYSEHFEKWVIVVTPYFVIPLFMVLPLIMLVIDWIRNGIKKVEG